MRKLFVLLLSIQSLTGFGQEPASMNDSSSVKKNVNPGSALQSVAGISISPVPGFIPAGSLAVSFNNRFGALSGSAHSLFGFDRIADYRIGLGYGITDRLNLGIGRSKSKELLDGSISYRILEQSTTKHIPIYLDVYVNTCYSTQVGSHYFKGTEADTNFHQREAYRFSYLAQVRIGRSIGTRFFLSIQPGISHRNFVIGYINPNNEAVESNTLLFATGYGAIRLTRSLCFSAEYDYNFSPYRKNNPITPYHAPLLLALDWQTGDWKLQFNLSNTSAVMENNFIPANSAKWLDGQIRVGFSVVRTFKVHSRKS